MSSCLHSDLSLAVCYELALSCCCCCRPGLGQMSWSQDDFWLFDYSEFVNRGAVQRVQENGGRKRFGGFKESEPKVPFWLCHLRNLNYLCENVKQVVGSIHLELIDLFLPFCTFQKCLTSCRHCRCIPSWMANRWAGYPSPSLIFQLAFSCCMNWETHSFIYSSHIHTLSFCWELGVQKWIVLFCSVFCNNLLGKRIWKRIDTHV